MTTHDGREILAELFRHNRWANLALVDHCAGLGDEALDHRVSAAYGSARDTLLHLAAAEERYVAILTGSPPAEPLREDQPFPGFDRLRERLAASGSALEDLAGTLEADATWKSHYQGKDWESKSLVVLVQAINHATEHREQVKGALTTHGEDVPHLDGWTYSTSAGLLREVT